MFIPKDILQNFLMQFSLVKNFAKKYHCTGMKEDPVLVQQLFDFYHSHCHVSGKNVLELGPGQTFGVLRKALEVGANSCAAIDIMEYPSPELQKGKIDFRLYDGKLLPYEDGRFDIVWACDVFEHLRYPQTTIREIYRVLAPQGKLICKTDLRDHYYLHDDRRWFECLRYSQWMWNALTWNRTSYVNRLRICQWEKLFAEVGFATVSMEYKNVTRDLQQYRQDKHLQHLSDKDLACYRYDAVLEKSG